MLAKDLQPGDVVRVSRLVTVEAVRKDHFIVETYRSFYDNTNTDLSRSQWDMELVERPLKGWPPEEGDVWKFEGNELHILRDRVQGFPSMIKLKAVSADGTYEFFRMNDIKSYPDLKLVYRREK